MLRLFAVAVFVTTTGLFVQKNPVRGSYVAFQFDALAHHQYDLEEDQSITCRYAMEGRRSSKSNIGSWEVKGSVISIHILQKYTENHNSNNYKIVFFDEFIFLVPEKEMKDWNKLMSRMTEGFEADEIIVSLKAYTPSDEKEDTEKKVKNSIHEFKRRIIERVISDRDILVKL